MRKSSGRRLPKLRKKSQRSGKFYAVVTVKGRDYYLGAEYGTVACNRAYERFIADYVANGFVVPDQVDEDPRITIAELCRDFYRHAKTYYVKDGEPTVTLSLFKLTIQLLKTNYLDTPAEEFGPKRLKQLRETMIAKGWSRRYVNDTVARIKQMFKWAVSEELIDVNVWVSLKTVRGLPKGRRTDVKETDPIQPVEDSAVSRTLSFLPPTVAIMVRFQRLTGCRPQEVRLIRPCDIDCTGDVWLYRPIRHKTQHREKSRIIAIGPKAQEVLRPYLVRDASAYCFSPAESERQRRQIAHNERTTPLSCGNRPGTNLKPKRQQRTFSDHYSKRSYSNAIHRACDKSFPPPEELAGDELKAWQKAHRWSPNQLRHTAATEIRAKFDLESASTVLGHSSLSVTEIYAERNLELAVKVAREVG